MPSRSGFDKDAFERLWADVARFILADAGDAADVGTERTENDLASAGPPVS